MFCKISMCIKFIFIFNIHSMHIQCFNIFSLFVLMILTFLLSYHKSGDNIASKNTFQAFFLKIKEYLFSGEHHETFVGFNSVTDKDHFKDENWHIFKFFSSFSKVWIIEPVFNFRLCLSPEMLAYEIRVKRA